MRSTTNELTIVQSLCHGIGSLTGYQNSIKCIQDDEEYVLTRNGLTYLKALNHDSWVYKTLYESCFNFQQQFGYGSEDFLLCIKLWCQLFQELIDLEIPTAVISISLANIIESLFQDSQSPMNHSIQSLKDLKYFLFKHGKLSITDLNQQPQKQKIKFSRYSRHSIDVDKESDCDHKYEIFSKFFEFVIDTLSEDHEIRSITKELFCFICKEQKPETSIDLHIPDINVELLPRTTSDTFPKVYKGILIPCSSCQYFDILSVVGEKPVQLKAVLVNTLAYGDSLGNPKDIRIRQVFDSKTYSRSNVFDEFRNNSSGNFHEQGMITSRGQEQIGTLESSHSDSETLQSTFPYENSERQISSEPFSKLKKTEVNFMIHRGELPLSLIEYCKSKQIQILSVPTYETLYRIQKTCGGNIIFDVENDLRLTDISDVRLQCHTVQWSVDDRIDSNKRVSRSATVCGFIQIEDGLVKTFGDSSYTVLIQGRGQDLAILHKEAFLNTLNRLKHIVRKRDLVTKSIEAHFVESLKSKALKTGNYHECPPWIQPDLDLFQDLIQEKVVLMFEKFTRCFTKDDSKLDIQCLDFKKRLWVDSLRFVTMIVNTRSAAEFSL
eukprot:TCONS_00013042-protein